MVAKPDSWGTVIFLVLLWLLGTLVTIAADVTVGLQMARQLWAYNYLPVQGVLLENEVKDEGSGDDVSHEAHVRYTYAVGGHEYEGSRIRFSYISGGTKEYVASDLPLEKVGDSITVYYSPNDPSVAVLKPGLTTLSWLFPLFLIPLNGISLCGVLMMVDQRKTRALGRPWLGVQVWESGTGATHIKLYEWSPWMNMLFGAGFAGFFFPLGLLYVPSQTFSDLSKVILGWLGLLAAVVYCWRRSQQRSTLLIVDDFHSQVTYKNFNDGKEELLDRKDLAFVTRRAATITDSEGESSSTTELELTTHDDRVLPLKMIKNEEYSSLFARWLADRLKIQVRTVEELDDDDEFDDEEDENDGDD